MSLASMRSYVIYLCPNQALGHDPGLARGVGDGIDSNLQTVADFRALRGVLLRPWKVQQPALSPAASMRPLTDVAAHPKETMSPRGGIENESEER
jgi:hypothetical protein